MEAHGGVEGAAMDAAWWLTFQVAAMEAAGANRSREEGGRCGGALLLQWLPTLLFALQVALICGGRDPMLQFDAVERCRNAGADA